MSKEGRGRDRHGGNTGTKPAQGERAVGGHCRAHSRCLLSVSSFPGRKETEGQEGDSPAGRMRRSCDGRVDPRRGRTVGTE